MPRHQRFKWAEWARITADKFHKDDPEFLAIDTETSGVSFYDEAFCATLAWADNEGRVQSGYFELSDTIAAQELSLILDRNINFVFHNAKFDLQKLIQAGLLERGELKPQEIYDTECIAQLLDEHRPKGLKDLGKSLLGHEDREAQHLTKVRRKLKLKKDDGYHLLPREVIVPYAVKDAELTLGIFNAMWPIKDEQLSTLFRSEMELILAMLDVEAAGLDVDLEYVERTSKEIATSILKTEIEIGKLIGKKVWYPAKPGQKTPEGCFNPNSHEQVARELLNRGLSVPNTQSDTLKELGDPFGNLMLEMREAKKVYDYFVAIKREHRDGRIHPWFNLFKPHTGRMSSSKGHD